MSELIKKKKYYIYNIYSFKIPEFQKILLGNPKYIDIIVTL